MATHLVMGDPHCTPKASNDRFLWAGKLARDLKPNVVVCMGDFASMDSLSSYDKGKKQFEGRRYKKDIDHSHDALEKFNKGLDGRRPRKIMLLGNHEDRIDRTVDDIPELEGTISTDDFKFENMVGKFIHTNSLSMLMVYIIATTILLVSWVSLLAVTMLLVPFF